MACHQLGNKATREVPVELGEFDSLEAAWDRRIQSGQAGGNMVRGLGTLGRERALTMFADWTERITLRGVAAGTAEAPGPGAKRRHHPVGLGRSEGLSPR